MVCLVDTTPPVLVNAGGWLHRFDPATGQELGRARAAPRGDDLVRVPGAAAGAPAPRHRWSGRPGAAVGSGARGAGRRPAARPERHQLHLAVRPGRRRRPVDPLTGAVAGPTLPGDGQRVTAMCALRTGGDRTLVAVGSGRTVRLGDVAAEGLVGAPL